MKISFATSFLVSVVLTSTAVSARATEESIDDHSSPTSTKVISLGPTDTHFNFYTLWEKQFSNDDAKQLQMSMAISNGYVFVGMEYYDSVDDRKGNLFIRRFDTSTGDEQDFTFVIPSLPTGYVYSKPVIFSDGDGSLFWARIVQDNNSSTHFAQLYVYQMAVDGDNITSTFVRGYDIGDKGRAAYYLESIDNITGSVLENTAELQFIFAEKVGNIITQYLIYINKKDDGEYDFATKELPSPDNKSFTQSDHTAITWHPTKKGVFATHEYISHSGSKSFLSPRVFNATYYSTSISITPKGQIETEEMLDYRKYWKDHDDVSFNGNPFCLGIHAFEHLGVPMMVIPVINYDNRSQFQLLYWPESDTMTEAKHITLLPETPFTIPVLKYPDSRQLIKTEKVAPSPSSRADIGEPATRLYIFSPSAGIAAYSIGSRIVNTGIEDIIAEKPAFRISGRTLHVDSADDTDAIITDTQGRTVLRTTIQDGTADLSPLCSGIYILQIGQLSTKIAL